MRLDKLSKDELIFQISNQAKEIDLLKAQKKSFKADKKEVSRTIKILKSDVKQARSILENLRWA